MTGSIPSGGGATPTAATASLSGVVKLDSGVDISGFSSEFEKRVAAMAADFKTKTGKTLYSYWSDKVTNYLESEISPNGYLLNLASDEYFKLIDSKNFQRKILHFKFFQTKGKDLKSVPTFSKQARGSMARFVIETNAKSIADLQKFKEEGYSINEKLSDANTLVFVR